MGSIFKTSVLLVLLFLVAISVIGFFLPNEKRIVVSKEMTCKPEEVFEMINELKNWEKWSPWYKLDPNMKLEYSTPSLSKGAWYTWNGNSDVGSGKLEIKNTIENSKIETILQFETQDATEGGFEISPTEKGSIVHWYINTNIGDGILSKIYGGYRYLLMRHFISSDFAKGLENIEKSCSK